MRQTIILFKNQITGRRFKIINWSVSPRYVTNFAELGKKKRLENDKENIYSLNLQKLLKGVAKSMKETMKDIKLTQKKIDEIQIKIEQSSSESEKVYLMDKEAKLMDEKAKLMDEKVKLMDKEAKLMDEKAKLMDEKAKLIDNETKLMNEGNDSSRIVLAKFPVYSNFDQYKVNENFPINGIGLKLFTRKSLVNEIHSLIKSCENNYFEHVYIRGAKATGKTTLLRCIANDLVEQNKKVYYLMSPGWLRNFDISTILNMEKLLGPNEKQYIFIDEIQEDKSAPLLNYLLKDARKTIVIAFGIPNFDGSADFMCKTSSTFLFLKKDDLDDEILDYFHALASWLNRNDVQFVLDWILSYTGGQTYAFLALSYHICENSNKYLIDLKCTPSFMTKLFYQIILYESKLYDKVATRCFGKFSPEVLAATNLIQSNFHDLMDMKVIENYGLNADNEYRLFRSVFFEIFVFSYINNVMADTKPELLYLLNDLDFNESKDKRKDALIKIIDHCFSQFQRSDLTEPSSKTTIIENALIIKFLYKLLLFPSLHIQSQVFVSNPESKKVGYIDLLINGKINFFVEFIRNSNDLSSHFARFEDETGAYHDYRDKYIIIDIRTHSDSPPRIYESNDYYQKFQDNYICFIPSTNCLYHGNVLLKRGVSEYLSNPPTIS